MCYNGGFIGLSGGGGGLSENVVVPQKAIIPLPSNIPLDVGALVEPLSVAWHAVSAAPLDTSSSALILGGGAFVHAPSSTGVVRVERLMSTYWSQRFLGARRLQ